MAGVDAGSKMRCLYLWASRLPSAFCPTGRSAVRPPAVAPIWRLAMDRTMSSLTEDLGSFVADLSLRRIPPQACEIARTGIADCFGVLVAGARDPAIALIDREMGEGGASPRTSSTTTTSVSTGNRAPCSFRRSAGEPRAAGDARYWPAERQGGRVHPSWRRSWLRRRRSLGSRSTRTSGFCKD
jgi:hypothetical protein